MAIIANNSWTHVEARSSLGLNSLLKKAMRWPFYDKTTPMTTADAFISKVNGREESGRSKTGAEVGASFNLLKAS